MATKDTKKDAIQLVSPDGRDYSTTDRVEATSLRARGYKLKETAKKAASTTPTK